MQRSLTYRGLSLPPMSIFRYCVCAIRSYPMNKEWVYWNSSCCRVLLNDHSYKNKDSKKQPFPICLSVKLNDGRKSIKKEKKFFLRNVRYCEFGQDGWKNWNFFMKISWIWTCSQMFRKFSYWESLLLFWMILKADSRLRWRNNFLNV